MPRGGAERTVLGCFQVVGARRPSLSYEEGSASAPSTTSASPPTSSASTSSPAFLDDDDDAPVYLLGDAEPEPEPDAGRLSTAIAARRFFPASPGRSNSIVDSAEHPPPAAAGASLSLQDAGDSSSNVRALRRAATSAFPASSSAAASSSSAAAKHQAAFRDGGDNMMQPVRKVSLSTETPRADFFKSMVEMVEALGLDPRRRDADLARLHDLLLCYIALNDRDALRDILGAFSDLMSLLELDADKNSAASTAAATAGDGGGEKKRDAGVQGGGGRAARG